MHMKHLSLAILLLCLGLALRAQVGDPGFAQKLQSLYKGTVPLVTPAELQALQVGQVVPLVLDTRRPREFEVSHIPGATFVDYDKFGKAAAKALPRDRVVVVYCSVGYRSERVGEQLRALGFTHVYNLEGGIFEWSNQGLPLVDGQGRPTRQVHAYSQEWGVWLQKAEKVYE